MKGFCKNNKRLIFVLTIAASLITLFILRHAAIKKSTRADTNGYREIALLQTVDSYDNLKKLLERVELASNQNYKPPLFINRAYYQNYSYTLDDGAGTRCNFSTELAVMNDRDIYSVSKRNLMIIETLAGGQLNIKASIKIEDEHFTPETISVHGDYILIAGRTLSNYQLSADNARSIFSDIQNRESTKIMLFVLEGDNKLKQFRTVEIEGMYMTSRKIDSQVYLFSEKKINFLQKNPGQVIPAYKDSSISDNYINIGYREINYLESSMEPSYLISASIDLEKPEDKINIAAYFGFGNNVYISKRNLYAVVSGIETSDSASAINRKTSLIYKLSMINGNIKYSGKTSVYGTVLSPYSLNEYGDFVRIVTTVGTIWGSDDNTSKNNLYIFDHNFKIVGALEDIAPGERILYATFSRDTAGLMTDKGDGPIYAIDIADPVKPYITDILYLPENTGQVHALTGQRLLIFTKDNVDEIFKGKIKVKILHLSSSSLANEEFSATIETSGTISCISFDNYSAFSTSNEELLLPVSIIEQSEQSAFSQGFYLYAFNSKKGIHFNGFISHSLREGKLRSEDSHRNIKTLLYLDGFLYTISDWGVKAYCLSSFNERGSISFEDKK
jgi:inhibitor of cysteine peptidase